MNAEIAAVMAGESQGCIVCGDGPGMLALYKIYAEMIFLDPPDNLGLQYDGYRDRLPAAEYESTLRRWLSRSTVHGTTVFFTPNARYEPVLWPMMATWDRCEVRKIIWRFTFGQYRQNDLGNGYRPIFRIRQDGAPLYPDAIREPSARQTQYNDKRADPRGRVPDDVWDFPRVCGTFKKRRRWHPTQFPQALVERCILLSTKPGDLVVDPMAGSGTTYRAAMKLGRRCIAIDISQTYVDRMRAEAEGG